MTGTAAGSTVLALMDARATFSSTSSELLAGLAAWRRRVEAVQLAGKTSAEAGAGTKSAADDWTSRPGLLAEVTALVNDGSALASE